MNNIVLAGVRQSHEVNPDLLYAPAGNAHYPAVKDMLWRPIMNSVAVASGSNIEACRASLAQAPQVNFLTFPNIETPHSCSTRLGGVSRQPYEGLNIGQSTKDAPSFVHENRLRLTAACGISQVSLLAMVHGTQIVRIDSTPKTLRQGDGCITDTVGQPLMITTADCVPLIFFDPKRRVIAITHAGWRGTVARIASVTVKSFIDLYNSHPQDLRVAIGPSIGPCCFKVGEDVSKLFTGQFPGQDLCYSQGKEGAKEFYIDLWRANFLALVESGVKPENVCIARMCSACLSGLFFSYRRDRQITGRMSSSAVLE